MPETKRPLKVFLCHASADKPKVRELYRTLRRRGLQPWLDAEDLIPGQNWELEIPKALLSSDAIIICLSPNSVDKEGYVQKEIKFALDKALEMPEGRIFLIPARLEECDLPFSLSKYQAVNLFEKDGYTKLMRALKLRASQLHLAEVALPKAGEITGEIKEIVEEKKHLEPKAEKPEIQTPKPTTQKIDIGGEVSDSVIVTGSNNVINVGKQESSHPKLEEEHAVETSEPAIEKPQAKKTKLPRKPNTAIIVALIGLAGTVIAALLSSPLAENWFSPAPVATEIESATSTFTLTSQPITPSITIEPSRTPTRNITSTITPLPTEITDAKGVPMVLVPEGTFIMGSDEEAFYLDEDESPAHNVYLDAFYIDTYEVTNSFYKDCVNSGVCDEPHAKGSHNRTRYYGDSEFNDYPVIYVDWYQAKTYCEWRGTRLPTEAEWEKAARGTDGRFYPWGISEIGVTYTGENTGDTTKVGSYPDGKSVYGTFDMAGNVWEWVNDWYKSDYYTILGDNAVNPQGPEGAEGNSKVLRGGSWLPLGFVRGDGIWNEDDDSTFNRYREFPLRFYNDVGFRCAMDANP
ncbi:MAG: SUMF1/EgtB/PvdO family nonheme iron enzyme [Anaerolineales bacterium]|nr:SUMF1/EgtB/PvdO family nonheme iron enzyme [Anaerolineales bacterium]